MMVKEGVTLYMKSLGPNTVGQIKKNREGKVSFHGMYPLVNFGMFADSCEASESHESSDRVISEDDVISEEDVIHVSDHEDNVVTPVAIVAEEHNLQFVHVESDYNEGTMEDATENEGDDDDSFNDIDLSGLDKDDISLIFGGNDNFLSNEDLNSFFASIRDVAHPKTEIRDT